MCSSSTCSSFSSIWSSCSSSSCSSIWSSFSSICSSSIWFSSTSSFSSICSSSICSSSMCSSSICSSSIWFSSTSSFSSSICSSSICSSSTWSSSTCSSSTPFITTSSFSSSWSICDKFSFITTSSSTGFVSSFSSVSITNSSFFSSSFSFSLFFSSWPPSSLVLISSILSVSREENSNCSFLISSSVSFSGATGVGTGVIIGVVEDWKDSGDNNVPGWIRNSFTAVFSPSCFPSIGEILEDKDRCPIGLNRRGFAFSVSCKEWSVLLWSTEFDSTVIEGLLFSLTAIESFILEGVSSFFTDSPNGAAVDIADICKDS